MYGVVDFCGSRSRARRVRCAWCGELCRAAGDIGAAVAGGAPGPWLRRGRHRATAAARHRRRQGIEPARGLIRAESLRRGRAERLSPEEELPSGASATHAVLESAAT